MKKLLKFIPALFILLLVIRLYSESLAFSDVNNCIDFNAGAVGNLKDGYRLYFFPLTPCETKRFKSGIIEFAETDSTFSLTLFSKGDPDGVTYTDCPYEAYGGYQSTLFVGYPPPGLDGAGFTLTGITVGNRLLVGFFQFSLATSPPIECSYLFWGIIINRK